MKTDWADALNRRQASQSFQPQGSGGAQRAGVPGMGAGSIPYAPGATSYQANTEPARHTPQPQSSTPSAPPAGPAAGSPGYGAQQAPAAAPMGGPGMAPDPMAVMRVANMLMERYRRAQGLRYRG